MEIIVEQPDKERVTFKMKGELVIAQCTPTRSKIMKSVDEGAKAITLDLTDVNFIDSAGLGLLIGIRQSIRGKGGELHLTGVNKRILPLFQMTRLNKIFGLPDE